MENEYYQPSVEEFHVGFEFELYDDCSDGNFDWTQQIFCQTILPSDISYIKSSVLWDFMALNSAVKEERVRVKYLDTEDIIELGWKQFGHPHSYASWAIGDFELGYYDEKHTVIFIEKGKDYHFVGTIKNKSELKKLMTQLGI
jgi:hypothetical protein